ncbi:MAG TPA: hypothetical protein VFX21_01760, partial [Acidimicrobiia bacterium]|nr:hypothetical protein [Acidimicrobiia bacterium]
MTAFEPPGNGEWRSFAEHLPHPIARVFEQLFVDTIADGMGRAFVRYGIPVKTITLRFVHGHAYLAPAPLMESKGRALPPKPILWIAARVHPEFRRREKAARNALATRIWRQDTARWFDELRDVWIERNRALQAVDPAGLADDELAVHTRECFENVIAGYK